LVKHIFTPSIELKPWGIFDSSQPISKGVNIISYSVGTMFYHLCGIITQLFVVFGSTKTSSNSCP
jgi:hypothetical protein